LRKRTIVPLAAVLSAAAVVAAGAGAAAANNGRPGPGGQRSDETPLTGDTLSKVTAAALAKVPGATVIRAETDADGHAKYEAHLRTSDGKQVTVYVNESFAVVSVENGPGGGPKPANGGAGKHAGHLA
jgi:hypothetical protein